MTSREEHSFRKAFPWESYPQFYSEQGKLIKDECRWICDIVSWRLRVMFAAQEGP